MTLFPVFLKLAGKDALVVGDGAVARAKIEQLIAAGANVRVITGGKTIDIDDSRLEIAGDTRRVRWHHREFLATDVVGATVVFAASGSRELDREVFRACSERGVLCNVIDDPEYCDFYSPAVVDRGDLKIAISTNGQSPALAQQIRQELEGQFDASWAERVEELGRKRKRALQTMTAGPERVAELHRQAREALRVHRTKTKGPSTRTDVLAQDDRCERALAQDDRSVRESA